MTTYLATLPSNKGAKRMDQVHKVCQSIACPLINVVLRLTEEVLNQVSDFRQLFKLKEKKPKTADRGEIRFIILTIDADM